MDLATELGSATSSWRLGRALEEIQEERHDGRHPRVSISLTTRPVPIHTRACFLETKVSPGGLNFDEVVVYNEDAALPTNLIVYSFYE